MRWRGGLNCERRVDLSGQVNHKWSCGHNEQDGSGHCFRRDGQTAHSQQGEVFIRVKVCRGLSDGSVNR